MGTRSLTMVFFNNEYKVAQYGQFDGYPEGQGSTILEFLKNHENIITLTDSLSKVRFLDRDGKDKVFSDEYDNNAPEWSNEPDNRTQSQRRWFSQYISRDIGGKILENICKSLDEEIIINNRMDFIKDTFCEWVYVVDLDKKELEVYCGYNHEPLSKDARFYCDGHSEYFKWSENTYYPPKMVKSYNLLDLPSTQDFVSEINSLTYDEQDEE